MNGVSTLHITYEYGILHPRGEFLHSSCGAYRILYQRGKVLYPTHGTCGILSEKGKELHQPHVVYEILCKRGKGFNPFLVYTGFYILLVIHFIHQIYVVVHLEFDVLFPVILWRGTPISFSVDTKVNGDITTRGFMN